MNEKGDGKTTIQEKKGQKKGWIEILPRFKIQYPMKNRDEATAIIDASQA
ncbi:MAG TPA: hypothetical protein VHK91_04715 [Flavisolibacter sp.]|jgi:hypothetical protein|nr:hypothetical protein [Flavisolibacter sp.]